jgi:acetyl esterase/lipase
MAVSAGIVMDLLARSEHHRYGPHRQHRADLHVPRDGGRPVPVVVLIHGGYWRAKYGKVVMKPIAADLVRRGFAAWNIEYRRVGRRQGGGYPETFDDVIAALDHLADLGDERIDLGDVTLMGHSAGGHLALWAASSGRSGLEFRRVVAQAPITDLARAGQAAHTFMRGNPQTHPERYAACDPMRMLPVGSPLLLVHTPEDATISLKRTRAYAEAARAAGDDVTLVEPPGGHRSHIDPRTPAWRAVTDWLSPARAPQPSATY